MMASKQQNHGSERDLPQYGTAVDVWAAGVLAYELLLGGPPFEADSQEETFQRILEDVPFLPSHLSPAARLFLTQASP